MSSEKCQKQSQLMGCKERGGGPDLTPGPSFADPATSHVCKRQITFVFTTLSFTSQFPKVLWLSTHRSRSWRLLPWSRIHFYRISNSFSVVLFPNFCRFRLALSPLSILTPGILVKTLAQRVAVVPWLVVHPSTLIFCLIKIPIMSLPC